MIMTQEDRELLLKDLSGRLPYGVFCVGTTYELDDDGEKYIPVKVKDILTEIHNYKLETAFVRLGLISSCKLETVKPYLRRLSSMTEEEKEELFNLSTMGNAGVNTCWESFGVEIISTHPRYGDHYSTDYRVIDWLNKKMFDYHGLIEKGLAIEVTPENNPYKD